MRHPLENIPAERLPRLFWPSLVATLLVMLLLNLEGQPMNNPAAPYGIVSFELAGTLDRARQILDSWNVLARLSSAFSLGFDYLFMVIYSTTIGLGCIWAGQALRRLNWPLAGLGPPLAWGLWLAAIFDATENLALTILLFGRLADPWPRVASVCATLKFSLIFLGMIYAFYAGIVYWTTRLIRTTSHA